MYGKFGLTVLATLTVLSLVITQDSAAQANPAHNHIGHVADGFRGTPDGVGLLDAAIAEAGVAAQHAGFAARDPSNLESMKRHMAHVLHALNPEEVENEHPRDRLKALGSRCDEKWSESNAGIIDVGYLRGRGRNPGKNYELKDPGTRRNHLGSQTSPNQPKPA